MQPGCWHCQSNLSELKKGNNDVNTYAYFLKTLILIKLFWQLLWKFEFFLLQYLVTLASYQRHLDTFSVSQYLKGIPSCSSHLIKQPMDSGFLDESVTEVVSEDSAKVSEHDSNLFPRL